VKIKLTFKYHEDNVIPPRCRKPRTIYGLEGSTTVTIKETSFDQLVHVCSTFSNKTGNGEIVTTKYFHYKGQLYIKSNDDASFLSEENPYRYYSYSDTMENRKKEAKIWANNWLLVDGILYETIGEPRWVIMTFGLGGNHGGSGFSLTNFYNSNISKSRYFRLDQKELMYKTFEAIALGRGDTKSVPQDFSWENAEVYAPEYLKVSPNKQHGDGDPFINGIENMISAVKNPTVSGLMVMAKAAEILK